MVWFCSCPQPHCCSDWCNQRLLSGCSHCVGPPPPPPPPPLPPLPPPLLLCGSSSFLCSAPANLRSLLITAAEELEVVFLRSECLLILHATQIGWVQGCVGVWSWMQIIVPLQSRSPANCSLSSDMQNECWHMLTLPSQPCDTANRWQEHADSGGPTGHKICFCSSPSCIHSPCLFNWKKLRMCSTYLCLRPCFKPGSVCSSATSARCTVLCTMEPELQQTTRRMSLWQQRTTLNAILCF